MAYLSWLKQVFLFLNLTAFRSWKQSDFFMQTEWIPINMLVLSRDELHWYFPCRNTSKHDFFLQTGSAVVVSRIIQPFLHLNFQVLKHIKEASWCMNPRHHAAERCCFSSTASLVGGLRIQRGGHRRDENEDRCRWLDCTFPFANTSLPRSSLLCHLTERLASLSARLFVYRWAAGTLWHAGGLPMRSNGYGDAPAWPDDLQKKPQRRAGKWDLLSCTYESLRPRLHSWAAALLSCLLFGQISGWLVSTSDSETWRNDLISSTFLEIRRW